MKAAGRKSGRGRADKRSAADVSVCDALRHPIRVRILEAICESDLSPIQFLRRGLLPPGFDFEGDEQNAVSTVSYHFKVLLEADCVVLQDTVPRRGANEHIYRSKMLALHTDEDFETMSFEQRRQISRSTLQMLIARADGAIYQAPSTSAPTVTSAGCRWSWTNRAGKNFGTCRRRPWSAPKGSKPPPSRAS